MSPFYLPARLKTVLENLGQVKCKLLGPKNTSLQRRTLTVIWLLQYKLYSGQHKTDTIVSVLKQTIPVNSLVLFVYEVHMLDIQSYKTCTLLRK